MKRRQRVFHDAFVLAAETFADQFFQFRHVEIEHPRDEAERVNVFALVLGRAADGFDGQRGNGNADVMIILLPFRLRLDVVGIIKHDAALFERADVVFVGMLIKRQQHVGLVARAQHLARTDAHLENGRAAGNRGRNGHERHDFLLAAAGQPRQKTADGLDAVLRIAGDADDRLVDSRNLRRSARRAAVAIVSLMDF